MGGLFRAPKPVIIAPPPAPTTPPPDQAAAAIGAEARAEAGQRARRGLSGTIATSARGVLSPEPAAWAGSAALAPQRWAPAARKTLLGE